MADPAEPVVRWQIRFDTNQDLYEQLERPDMFMYQYRVCDIRDVHHRWSGGGSQKRHNHILRFKMSAESPLAPGEVRTPAERAHMRAFILQSACAISDAEYAALCSEENAPRAPL